MGFNVASCLSYEGSKCGQLYSIYSLLEGEKYPVTLDNMLFVYPRCCLSYSSTSHRLRLDFVFREPFPNQLKYRSRWRLVKKHAKNLLMEGLAKLVGLQECELGARNFIY